MYVMMVLEHSDVEAIVPHSPLRMSTGKQTNVKFLDPKQKFEIIHLKNHRKAGEAKADTKLQTHDRYKHF